MEKTYGRGRKMSDESKRKMSLAKMGKKPWNYGKPWPDEFKKKMSESHKNNIAICEKLRKISISNRGKSMSPATQFKKGKHASKNTEYKIGGENNLRYRSENRWQIPGGYIVLRANGYKPGDKCENIFEHRFVIENHIGRNLTCKEIVHHVNKIRNDNRLENLMVFSSNSAHHRFHNDETNVKIKEIIFDGRVLSKHTS